MKNLTLTIRLCLLVGTLGYSFQALGETLTITVNEIRQTSGTLQLSVLASQDQFEGEENAIAQFRHAAIAGQMTFTVNNLPYGQYAVMAFHDVNGNNELDTNLVGVPAEPYAFSNNARNAYGPAKWEDARFTFDTDLTHTIDLTTN